MKKNTTPTYKDLLEKAICRKHSGKMEGMQSLSTSVTLNPHCQERAKHADCVCSHCYASRMLNMYKTLEAKLADNTALLTREIIAREFIPHLNVIMFRFEAFGDLNNEVQVFNYFNIANENPFTRFALWTKNPWIIQNAIEQGAIKPENVTIIYSSPALNCRADNMLNLYSFIDKIFTVWTKDYLEQHPEIVINCGKKKCIACGICYLKNNIVFVDEVLK